MASLAKPLLLFRYFVWQFAYNQLDTTVMSPPVSGPNVKLRANSAWSVHVTLSERIVVIGRKRSSSYNGSETTRVDSYFCLICVRFEN